MGKTFRAQMGDSLVSAFNIDQIDSGSFDVPAPQWFANQISQHLNTLSRTETSSPEGFYELNEIKLRLLSNAIVAVNLLPAERLPAWAGVLEDWLEGRTRKIGGPVFSTPSGLTYMLLENCMVTALPDLLSNGHIELALDELSEMHHLFPSVNYWIFDMASISSLPQMLAAYLIGFQNTENPLPPRLLIMWLKRDALPNGLAAPVIKHFHLMRKGAFLLSKF